MRGDGEIWEELCQAQARIADLEARLALYEAPRVPQSEVKHFPPGLVIVLGGDLARWHAFEQSFQAMIPNLPPDTQVAHATGQWLAVGINDCIRQFMRPCDQFVQIWADDHTFHYDILNRLLSHKVDIVAPLVCLRSPPFLYSAFHEVDGRFVSYTFDEFDGKTGLLEVDAMGGPGVVLSRRVIDAMGMPLFRGQAGEAPREDLVTFSAMRAKGFRVWVDTDLTIGHCGAGIVYPTRTEAGKYGVRFEFQGMEIGSVFYAPADADPTVPAGYHAST